MPNKTTKKSSAKKAPQKKLTAKKAPSKASAKNKKGTELEQIHYFIPWIIVILMLYTCICLFFPDYSGFIGKKLIRPVFFGLFGGGAYAIPLLMSVTAFFWKTDARHNYIKYRFLFSIVIITCLSAFIHSAGQMTKVFAIQELWEGGIALKCGGVWGGLVGSVLAAAIGKPGLIIVTVLLFLVFGIFFAGFTPSMVAKYLTQYFSVKRQEHKKNKAERKRYINKPEAYIPDDDYYDDDNNGYDPLENIDVNTPIEDTAPIDPEIFERIKADIEGHKNEDVSATPELDTDNLFVDENTQKLIDQAARSEAAELELQRTPLEETDKKPPVKEKPKYIFPPIATLPQTEKTQSGNVQEELRTNANKLVETLASFKVRTKIINISRGPAITRYELQPEEGVRVRSIANLVDDIALSLASEGIRIEAPIPGKAAVGIEVPNKTRSLVGLREQLESPEFKNASSRLTASLGVDVAGTPIYMDIAKMPHLLVAGATGQGKSVCINSTIVSILYKATPDEVKFILIDPKKVEFVPYNGLPHLLVPVVTDPKKAAGSLQWAVSEMERRYMLLENLGVRDIHSFNKKTKDDPTYEYLPQIVIIIDELADLMMTAPDQVEDSICRLAQKARAAGMHLILGTQRPSVDVVTGLIKANIPSRIACKTTSQVDSRTILDIAGAEKLVGRGDMLYMPVGAAKPIRVQGSFVHEDDVAKVTEFITSKSGETEYDTEVIEKIEKEAALCGAKKGAAPLSADDDDSDPMLNQAIEIAIEAGKISTSYLQRKLSLGYGRAAKIIDAMENMGVVGPPDGNKPRQVLISQNEYLEMTMKLGE